MSPQTFLWVLAAHLLAVVMWIGGMFAVYWLLRIHSHAPKDSHDQLTLMERSLALMMDLAATVAMGCGFAMAFSPVNLFTAPHAGWLHTKVAIVFLVLLPIHGMLRAKIKRFGQGKISAIPQWQWSLLLVAITAIIIAAVTKFATLQ